MKKLLTILLTIFLFCTPACNVYAQYKSSYDAKNMMQTNNSKQFSAAFEYLNGILVGKLKSSTANDGALQCKATLTQGEMNVYYDWGLNKELLFTLTAGESLDDIRGYYSNGAPVYVIIETVTPCKGNFTITI